MKAVARAGKTIAERPRAMVRDGRDDRKHNEAELIVPSRVPLNVFVGVPDHARVLVSPNGRELLLLGNCNILPFLSRERFAPRRFYLQKGVRVHLNLNEGAILNQMADPDVCSGALEMAERFISQIARPCFNPPASVARTSRDRVAQALSGIADLKVPKTIRVQHPTPKRVQDAIAHGQLEYPVLLRPAGTHWGTWLTKVDRPIDLDDMGRIGEADRDFYVTEFHDFVGKDGRYRKFRVVVAGPDIFLRHCIIGDSWLLHAARRATGTEHSEGEIFAVFDREWALQLQPIFREIGSRLGLDFFGVDCNIDNQGQVILFEANSAMSILKNTSPSPNMWDAPIARIKNALEERLASPSSWCGSIAE